ncbi:unnamed protein product [Clavelina lepadiformis]|uniref:Uncharacterized protein n=1 Tax=Clavelina lepadiformis TaxID=159417 RepID=A0ABP0F3E4_CLALP
MNMDKSKQYTLQVGNKTYSIVCTEESLSKRSHDKKTQQRLCQETNRRRRSMEEQKRLAEEREVRRRSLELSKRHQRQIEATQKYQRTFIVKHGRKNKILYGKKRSSLCGNVPGKFQAKTGTKSTNTNSVARSPQLHHNLMIEEDYVEATAEAFDQTMTFQSQLLKYDQNKPSEKNPENLCFNEHSPSKSITDEQQDSAESEVYTITPPSTATKSQFFNQRCFLESTERLLSREKVTAPNHLPSHHSPLQTLASPDMAVNNADDSSVEKILMSNLTDKLSIQSLLYSSKIPDKEYLGNCEETTTNLNTKNIVTTTQGSNKSEAVLNIADGDVIEDNAKHLLSIHSGLPALRKIPHFYVKSYHAWSTMNKKSPDLAELEINCSVESNKPKPSITTSKSVAVSGQDQTHKRVSNKTTTGTDSNSSAVETLEDLHNVTLPTNNAEVVNNSFVEASDLSKQQSNFGCAANISFNPSVKSILRRHSGCGDLKIMPQTKPCWLMPNGHKLVHTLKDNKNGFTKVQLHKPNVERPKSSPPKSVRWHSIEYNDGTSISIANGDKEIISQPYPPRPVLSNTAQDKSQNISSNKSKPSRRKPKTSQKSKEKKGTKGKKQKVPKKPKESKPKEIIEPHVKENKLFLTTKLLYSIDGKNTFEISKTLNQCTICLHETSDQVDQTLLVHQRTKGNANVTNKLSSSITSTILATKILPSDASRFRSLV